MDDRSPLTRSTCRIGPLTLDADNEVLLRDGVPLPLGRRAVGVLCRLVQTPGEIVGKEDLQDTVWRGQIRGGEQSPRPRSRIGHARVQAR